MSYYMPTSYLDDPPVIEMVYPVARPDSFKAVSAAVFYAAGRLNPRQPVQGQETDTGAIYLICLPAIVAQVFVLYAAEDIVDVRIHIIAAHAPREREFWRDPLQDDAIITAITQILQAVDEAVVGLLRVGVSLNDLKPPPPSVTDMRAVFNWQRIYYPSMTDGELAQRIGLEPQTVRNERSKHNFSKRLQSERLPLDEIRRRYPDHRWANEPVPRGRKRY